VRVRRASARRRGRVRGVVVGALDAALRQ
jgi:hypothetical protein